MDNKENKIPFIVDNNPKFNSLEEYFNYITLIGPVIEKLCNVEYNITIADETYKLSDIIKLYNEHKANSNQ